MNELEQLKKENEVLLRAINRLGGTIEKLLDINNHFKNDKQKHLAGIKADAVIRFAEFLRYSYEGAMSADSIEDTADEYANKLRSES